MIQERLKLKPFEKTCWEFLAAFLERFPNAQLRARVHSALPQLLAKNKLFSGKPAGWAGGLVHALGNRTGAGIPGILNRELEDVFGVSIGTIHKRSAQIWRMMESELLKLLVSANRQGTQTKYGHSN